MKPHINVKVTVNDLCQAKRVAGEWVAQFNQDGPTSPFVVLLNNKPKGHMEVVGFYQDGSPIPHEEVLNAKDVLHDL